MISSIWSLARVTAPLFSIYIILPVWCATSGFTTASIIQSGVSTGANYMVKKSTGKTISEHAMDALTQETLQQSYVPSKKNPRLKLKNKTRITR